MDCEHDECDDWNMDWVVSSKDEHVRAVIEDGDVSMRCSEKEVCVGWELNTTPITSVKIEGCNRGPTGAENVPAMKPTKGGCP